MSRIALMSLPQDHVLEVYFLPRALYAGTFPDASRSAMKSDRHNTFLRISPVFI